MTPALTLLILCDLAPFGLGEMFVLHSPVCVISEFGDGLNGGKWHTERPIGLRGTDRQNFFLSEQYSRFDPERALLQYDPDWHTRTMSIGSDKFLQTYFNHLEEHVQLAFVWRKAVHSRTQRYFTKSTSNSLSQGLGASIPSVFAEQTEEIPSVIPDLAWPNRSRVKLDSMNLSITFPLYFHWELEGYPFRDEWHRISFEN